MEAISGFFQGWGISPVDIAVLVGYMILMMLVGYLCRKASSNISDYIRLGNKGTWWLIGLSIFMQSISAITFTANCAQAYLAGWSAFWTTMGGVMGLLVHAFFLAGWMRNTRAVTPADNLRARFSPLVEQINVYFGLFTGLFWGGVFLLSLANFISAVFGMPVWIIIIFAGIAIVFYSVSGGAWSVMITDSLQSLIMIPICLALAFLSLKAVGGVDGLLAGIQERGLSADFKLIKEAGHVYTSTAGKVGKGYFTSFWLGAFLTMAITRAISMNQCHRYLAAKTGRDAHKAAFFAAALLFIGAFVWFIPPMVSRVLFEADVEALAATPAVMEQLVETRVEPLSANPGEEASVGKSAWVRAELKNPADGAYAIAAKKILPPGLLGLVMIAMFAAAMSSLDSFLTGSAGIVSRNIYPPLARLFKKKPLEGRPLLKMTKVINLFMGLWAIIMATLLNRYGTKAGIYEISMQILLLLGPISMPFTLSFFAWKLPRWGVVFGMGCGVALSLFFAFGKYLGAGVDEWPANLMWHHKMYISIFGVLGPTLFTSLFWKWETQEYKNHVAVFHKRLKTPIDFSEEVGESDDHTQLLMVGGLGLIIAAAILLLLIPVKGAEGMWTVVFVSLFIGSISLPMYLNGRAKTKIERGRRDRTGM